jgi:hypothetical protein
MTLNDAAALFERAMVGSPPPEAAQLANNVQATQKVVEKVVAATKPHFGKSPLKSPQLCDAQLTTLHIRAPG